MEDQMNGTEGRISLSHFLTGKRNKEKCPLSHYNKSTIAAGIPFSFFRIPIAQPVISASTDCFR